MAINLVSLVMQFLTPDMIGRIASALGLDATTRRPQLARRYRGCCLHLAVSPRNPAERKSSPKPQGSKPAPLATSPA